MSDRVHQPPTVLVTGANGYIGSAVCRAFVRAGYRTFGLIRKPEAARDIITTEAIPVIGTFDNLAFLDSLFHQATTFDVVVSCTDPIPGYEEHFRQVMSFVKIIAEKSNENGVRPLVLWSSGCKDYGMTELHGAPGLAPHTEDSPMNPPDVLKERTAHCDKVFGYTNLFDAVVLRPTCVYGYTSSYYGPMLDFVASELQKGNKVLRIPGDPNSIMHAVHIDDAAEAYLALATHPDRSAISGQAFNISSHRYETLQEVASALAQEYGFTSGVEFIPAAEADESFPPGLHFVFSFSQSVGSNKIRALTGWKDCRMLFTEGLHVYRLAYEAMKEVGHGNIGEMRKRIGGNFHQTGTVSNAAI